MEQDRHQETTFRYPRLWLWGLVGVFVGVHAVYYGLGLRFTRDTLGEVMHFADPALLQSQLCETLWYLHIQPPLLNLLVGVVLKITPESNALFTCVYLAFGLTLYLCVFILQCRLGVGERLAAVLSTLFMASPSFVIWEHYLLYTMPCAALVALAAVLLFHVQEKGAWWSIIAFFMAVLALAGLRTMFHWIYLALVLAAAVVMCGRHRRRVLVTGMVALALLLGVYTKNYALFGEFNVCTFSEKNLWIMTAGNLRWDDKVAQVEAGTLSELSLINRWCSLDEYPPQYKAVPERFRGIPVLDQTHKANGAVNYNHYGNIEICNLYGRDAKQVLRHQPKVFLISTVLSWYRYFKSSTSLPVSPELQAKMPRLIKVYDYLFYGKLPVDLAPYSRLVERGGNPPFVFLLLGLPAVWLFGLWRVFRPGDGRERVTTVQRTALFFLCFNIALVAVLGCSLDFLETARYRVMTDGLSVALLGFLLQQGLNRMQNAYPDDAKKV
jgi:hypothetical protein